MEYDDFEHTLKKLIQFLYDDKKSILLSEVYSYS